MTGRGVPVRMARVGIVAPAANVRALLVALAEHGGVDLGPAAAAPDGDVVDALRRLERASAAPATAVLQAEAADAGVLERDGRRDLLLGEAELAARAAGAVRHGAFAGVVGWVPAHGLAELTGQVSGAGAAVVELPAPRTAPPPTLLADVGAARGFRPLIDMYGSARYSDLDPTPFAALAFVVMFGLMFGDVGHGLLLVAAGLLVRRTRRPRFAALRRLWVIPVACGTAAALAGLLYGEAFGPTGLVPTLWLSPADDPVRLVGTAIGIGVVLLAAGNVLGAVNRFRSGDRRAAILAPGGGAGLLVLLGAGVAVLALVAGAPAGVVAAGAAIAAAGLGLVLAGLVAEASGGAAGVAEVVVEFVDTIVRFGGNAVSFSRLAAFGLMHAVIAAVVLDAARALSGGVVGWVLAAATFAVGNALAFGIEGVVAAIQALRLEYYELFSRVFAGEGEPFKPWRLPVERKVAME